ncbi:DUF6461 domain-containing protein [Actinomycetes bacterium M1A6_2h]
MEVVDLQRVLRMGQSADVIGKVAAEHDVVSIYGAEGIYSFQMWVDGVLQVNINPNEAEYDSPWSGADPARFVPIWDDVSPGAVSSAEKGLAFPQALFAAAETVTGVQVTEGVLMGADFVRGVVPRLPPPAGSEFVRRLRDAGWDARALEW